MVVVPNLMGFATFSPHLDAYGNSVRGVSFCQQLVDRFTFRIYVSLSGGRSGCKRDPRASQHNHKQQDSIDLRWAISQGDRYATKERDLMLDCMVAITLAAATQALGTEAPFEAMLERLPQQLTCSMTTATS